MAENRVIGRDGDVPWYLPADLRFFKRLTLGHTVVMGRRTFDSIGRRPLIGRRNIVVTRQPRFGASGVEVAHSLPQALELAEGEQDVFIAGGADIYRIALPIADRLYLTVVHAEVDGDVRFPEFDTADWELVSETRFEADERHEHAFSFRRYDRRRRL